MSENVALLKKPKILSRNQETLSSEIFQQMLLPIKQHLYNFIYKSLNFCEDANDVYQDTVLRAFKYIHSFSNPAENRNQTFKTWIFTIAHNEVKNNLKKNKNRIESLENEEKIILEEDKNPLISDIYEIAIKLKPSHRQVFFLFYYNRFSIREIADITAFSQGNIKFILNRTREQIKKILGVIHE